MPRSILCKDKTSALAALCRPGAPEDAGHNAAHPLYIDRDWATFEDVLFFLEQGKLPPRVVGGGDGARHSNIDGSDDSSGGGGGDAMALRLLYIDSAHYVLVSLRDAIEEHLFVIAQQQSDNGDGGGDGTTAMHGGGVLQTGTLAMPAQQGSGSPQSKSLLAAAAAITRSRSLHDSIDSSSPGRGYYVSPPGSPLQPAPAAASTAQQQHAYTTTTTTLRSPPRTATSSTFSSTLNNPLSPAAASLRRTLGEIDLDIPPQQHNNVAAQAELRQDGRQPVAAAASHSQGNYHDNEAQAGSQPYSPTSLSTSEYISGEWRRYYATIGVSGSRGIQQQHRPQQSTSSASSSSSSSAIPYNGQQQQMQVPASPLRASYDAIVHLAAATALPDPFGFTRTAKQAAGSSNNGSGLGQAGAAQLQAGSGRVDGYASMQAQQQQQPVSPPRAASSVTASTAARGSAGTDVDDQLDAGSEQSLSASLMAVRRAAAEVAAKL